MYVVGQSPARPRRPHAKRDAPLHVEQPGGGVHLFRNDGVAGKPEFAAAVELIGPGPKQRSEEPLRPDVGLYADIADADSDGDLDIVVGGYSMHQEKKRPFIWFYENRGGRKATNASTERR